MRKIMGTAFITARSLMIQKVKIIIIALMLAVLGLTTGCIKMFSDVTINANLSGTWKTKIFTADPKMIKKEDIEKEIKSKGIQNYTINPTRGEIVVNGKGDKEISDGWEIISPFKDQAELKNILKLLGVLGDPNQLTSEPFTRDKDNTNLVTVNLGKSTDETIIRVEGAFVKESVKGEIIDDKTVKFKNGQPIIFQFIPAVAFMGVSMNQAIGGVVIFLAIGGYLFYRKKYSQTDDIA